MLKRRTYCWRFVPQTALPSRQLLFPSRGTKPSSGQLALACKAKAAWSDSNARRAIAGISFRD